MLNSLKRWINGDPQSASQARTRKSELLLDNSELAKYLRYFSIGLKVSYYPEYRRELKIDSIILGYSINSQRIFSNLDIEIDADAITLFGDEDNRIEYEELRSFYFMIPKNYRSEMSLASAEASEKNLTQREVNDFARGNIITLFSSSAEGGLPSLDTNVIRSAVLKDGVYANIPVAFLEPRRDSFAFVDRRRHKRVLTEIPVTVKFGKASSPSPWLIDDFSERYLRIHPMDPEERMDRLDTGDRLVVIIDLHETNQRFVLSCTVLRRVRDSLVVKLNEILRNDRFVEIDQIEELEIKSALLNHPNTSKTASDRHD